MEENETPPEDGATTPNVLPACWADYDIASLLQRDLLIDAYVKAYPSYNAYTEHEDKGDNAHLWSGMFFIPDFEEDPPTEEMRKKFLKALILKQVIDMKEFNKKLPTAVVLNKRMVLLQVILHTIHHKYHKTVASVEHKSNKPTKLSQSEATIDSKVTLGQESDIILEMSVKTMLTFLFSLMKISWSSPDTRMSLLCSDVLSSCSDMLLNIPALSLANEIRLPKVARNGLNDVMKFLNTIITSDDVTDAESKNNANSTLLGLSILRGNIHYILIWMETCLTVMLEKDCESFSLQRTHFLHWVKVIMDKDQADPSEASESNDTIKFYKAAITILKKISEQAVQYTQVLTGTSIANAETNNSQEAFVWGSNSSHQLVEGNKDKILSPKRSDSFKKALQIEAGQYCTFVIFPDGSLYSCGKGTYGRLGLGDSNNQQHLRRINNCGRAIIQVSSSKGSDGHTLALAKDGKVYSWGDGDYGKLGHGNTLMQKVPKIINGPFRNKIVKFIAAGSRHSAAVTDNGELYTWGEGEHGRLGHGDSSGQKVPTLVRSIGPVSQVALGSSHTLALSKDGCTVWSFGAGDNGKLGHGDTNRIFYPKAIDALAGIHVRKIVAGTQASMALTSNGLIYVWGCGPCLGTGAADMVHLLPKIIDALQDQPIIDLSMGDSHCLALTKDHEVYTWGNNSMGQCGLGHCLTPVSWPTKINGLDGATIEQLCAGTSHSIVWTSPPVDRKMIALNKPYCISVSEETFMRLRKFLEIYIHNKEKLDEVTKDYRYSFSTQLLSYVLDLLSSHLLLAVKDETCTRSVLGDEGKTIMTYLLKLIDEPNLDIGLVTKIQSTLQIGAQFLLPKPEQRIEMLLTLLPQTTEDLKKATIGKLLLLNIVLESINDHTIITRMFGLSVYDDKKKANKQDDRITELKAMGIILRLILRSAALLSEKGTSEDVDVKNQEQQLSSIQSVSTPLSNQSQLQDSLFKLLYLLQLHLISFVTVAKHNDDVLSVVNEMICDYLDVFCQHACNAINTATHLLNDKEQSDTTKRNQVIDYLLKSLAGAPLFSLIHLLLTYPPKLLINFVEHDFIALFLALNKLNRLSPAFDVIEMQEIKWPFLNSEKRKTLDPCNFPIPTNSQHWVWLLDLQRTLGVLLGRVIHGTMTHIDELQVEAEYSSWIKSNLLVNGFEEREKLKEHALKECTEQIKTSTISTFSCKIRTELPKDTSYLIDLANGPTIHCMSELWQDVQAHAIASDLFIEGRKEHALVLATLRYTLASMLHHLGLLHAIVNKKCKNQILFAVFDMAFSVFFYVYDIPKNIEDLDARLEEADDEVSITQRCKSVLHKCSVILLCLVPVYQHGCCDELDKLQVETVCQQILTVLTDESQRDVIHCAMLEKIVDTHVERTRTRIHCMEILQRLIKEMEQEDVISSCQTYLLSSAFGKRTECVAKDDTSFYNHVAAAPKSLVSQIQTVYHSLLSSVEVISDATNDVDVYSFKRLLMYSVWTFEWASTDLQVLLPTFLRHLKHGEETEILETSRIRCLKAITVQAVEHDTVITTEFMHQLANSTFSSITPLLDNLSTKGTCETARRKLISQVALIKRCCLSSAVFARCLSSSECINELIKIIEHTKSCMQLRIMIFKCIKVILSSMVEVKGDQYEMIVKKLFHLLNVFIWEEPFTRASSSVDHDSVPQNIPITFKTKHPNVEVNEESKTISHGPGGKGYAVVDQNLTEGSVYYEWKFHITKDVQGNEGTCVGICQQPFKNTDYQMTSEMWLYRAYNGRLYNNGERAFILPSFTQGDYITCRYSRADRSVAFGKNDSEPQVAFTDLPCDGLYPCVLFYGLNPGEKVSISDMKKMSAKKSYCYEEPASTPSPMALCEAARNVLTTLLSHEGWSNLIFMHCLRVCTNVEDTLNRKSLLCAGEKRLFCNDLYPLLAFLAGVDHGLSAGRKCHDKNGREAMVLGGVWKGLKVCVQWSDSYSLNQLDYSQFQPLNTPNNIDLQPTTISSVKLLSLLCDVLSMLRISSKLHAQPIETDWPPVFASSDGQELYKELFQAQFTLLNLKALLRVIQSSDFASQLEKYYLSTDFDGKSKNKSSSTESIGDLREDDPIDDVLEDDEGNRFISLLKTLLATAQLKRHPMIRQNISLADVERSLNSIHNIVGSNEFTFKTEHMQTAHESYVEFDQVKTAEIIDQQSLTSSSETLTNNPSTPTSSQNIPRENSSNPIDSSPVSRRRGRRLYTRPFGLELTAPPTPDEVNNTTEESSRSVPPRPSEASAMVGLRDALGLRRRRMFAMQNRPGFRERESLQRTARLGSGRVRQARSSWSNLSQAANNPGLFEPVVVEQLINMGFHESHVRRAITINPVRPQHNQSRYLQQLVAWLIDHPSSDGDESNDDSNQGADGFVIDFENEDDDDDDDDEFEINQVDEPEIGGEIQEGSVRFDQPHSLGQLLSSVISSRNRRSSSNINDTDINDPFNLMLRMNGGTEDSDDEDVDMDMGADGVGPTSSVFARLAESFNQVPSTPIFCDICQTDVENFNMHMHTEHPGCGSHNSNHGYRSNGRYLGGWFGGMCGSGTPYYLLCQDCHTKYTKREIEQPITVPNDYPFHIDDVKEAPDFLGQVQILQEPDLQISPSLLLLHTDISLNQQAVSHVPFDASNPLGQTERHTTSLFTTKILQTNLKDSRKPITHQAVTLKKFQTAYCALKRLTAKTEAMLFGDIFLHVMNILVSLLHEPRQLSIALKDLGVHDVDRLISILADQLNLNGKYFCQLAPTLKKSRNTLIKIIRLLLKEKPHELNRLVDLSKDFLLINANNDIDGARKKTDSSTRSRNPTNLRQLYERVQIIMELVCCKDLLYSMPPKVLVLLLDGLCNCVVANNFNIRRWAAVKLDYVISVVFQAKLVKNKDCLSLPHQGLREVVMECKCLVNRMIDCAWNTTRKLFIACDGADNMVIDNLKDLSKNILQSQFKAEQCTSIKEMNFNTSGSYVASIVDSRMKVGLVNQIDTTFSTVSITKISCYCWLHHSTDADILDNVFIAGTKDGSVYHVKCCDDGSFEIRRLDHASVLGVAVSSVCYYVNQNNTRYLVVGFSTGMMFTGGVETENWNCTKHPYTVSIRDIQFHSAGLCFVTLANNPVIKVWARGEERVMLLQSLDYDLQYPTCFTWKPWRSEQNTVELAVGYNNGSVNIWKFRKPDRPVPLSQHDFEMKCELDELLLMDIDAEENHEQPLLSTDSLKCQTLSNHSCSITRLSYNEVGTILASGCQRGLVYVNFLEDQSKGANQISKSITPIKCLFWLDESSSLAYIGEHSTDIIVVNVPLLEEATETPFERHIKQILKELKINTNQQQQQQQPQRDGGKYTELLLKLLPDLIKIQYKFEQEKGTSQDVDVKNQQHVGTGTQLIYSSYLQSLISIAMMLNYDTIINTQYTSSNSSYNVDKEIDAMQWFHTYCKTVRSGIALKQREYFPASFWDDKHNIELFDESKDNTNWSLEQDEQIMHWFTNYPKHWEPELPQSVYAWGSGSHGQLVELSPGRLEPELVSSFTQVREIVCGQNCTFILQTNGSVMACGEGSYGRLGQGTSDDEPTLTPLSELQGYIIIQLATSLGGDGHSLAVADTGEVFSWGDGDYGKLGHGNSERQRKPKQIMGLQNQHVVQAACGFKHSVCVTADGKVYAFGQGENGVLGDGGSSSRRLPQQIMTLKDEHIGQVACGKNHTLALTSDGCRLFSWGDGDFGKLGLGSTTSKSTPTLIDSLRNVGLKKIGCGSRFSVAIGNNGLVYTFGHSNFIGNVDSATRDTAIPQVVQILSTHPIIDIAVGCEFVVTLDREHNLWTWGTNTEGQLGVGDNNPHYIPSKVEISDKKFTRLSAGTSHCAAWTGNIMAIRSPLNLTLGFPDEIPSCYDSLSKLSVTIIRDRLQVLWKFSEMVSQCWKLMNFSSQDDVCPSNIFQDGRLRSLLTTRTHALPLARALRTSTSHTRLAAPTITVKRFDTKGNLCEPVFKQVADQILNLKPPDSLLLTKAWKVKLVNEAADDAGGVFDEVVTHMCMARSAGDKLETDYDICDVLQEKGTSQDVDVKNQELEERKDLHLLIPTPNSEVDVGFNRDCFMVNPSRDSYDDLMHFKFLGILMGVAIRTKKPLHLHLAPSFWKQLVGIDITVEDIEEVDALFVQNIKMLRAVQSKTDENNVNDDIPLMTYACQSSDGRIIPLVPGGVTKTMKRRDCQTFIEKALTYRLNEVKLHMQCIREGLTCVIPAPIVTLMTSKRLEQLVCGSQHVDVAVLKKIARYREITVNDTQVTWLWEILESYSKDELVAFLRFVSGRSRLPSNLSDMPHKFQIVGAEKPRNGLPTAQTCFFVLRLPTYDSKKLMAEKLRYAFTNCRAIDTDNYMLEQNLMFT